MRPSLACPRASVPSPLDPRICDPHRADLVGSPCSVGFDSITQQIEHKLLKRGFQVRLCLGVVVAEHSLTSCRGLLLLVHVGQFNVIVVGAFLCSVCAGCGAAQRALAAAP